MEPIARYTLPTHFPASHSASRERCDERSRPRLWTRLTPSSKSCTAQGPHARTSHLAATGPARSCNGALLACRGVRRAPGARAQLLVLPSSAIPADPRGARRLVTPRGAWPIKPFTIRGLFTLLEPSLYTNDKPATALLNGRMLHNIPSFARAQANDRLSRQALQELAAAAHV